MSSTPKRKRSADSIGMRVEYAFDYAKAKRNRFAARMTRDTVAVVLEPDVASIFGSSDRVNMLLRSVISALPTRPASVRRRRRKAG